LHPEERATLLALLNHADFEGRDALLEQAGSAIADSRCGCGCATIGFDIDPRAPSAGRSYRPIPNQAEVFDDEGELSGGVIVFVADGYLSSLEIFYYGDEPILEFPPLDRLRLHRREP
jgi:hypothetical protein